MLPLRASHVTLLMGFLCIVQGARIVRDTADIPTELFKPVGHNAHNEPKRSNRGNSTVEQDLDTPINFQERFEGGVEVVNGENDAEEEDDFETQPLYRQGSRRTPLGFASGGSQRDGFPSELGTEINRPPFAGSSGFRGRNIRPTFIAVDGMHNTLSWPNQLPISSNNFGSQLSSRGPSGPFGPSNHFGGQLVSRGPDGSFSSSNNYHRTESYSYSSNGRGPPRIEQNVYDSRDPFGGVSVRNF